MRPSSSLLPVATAALLSLALACGGRQGSTQSATGAELSSQSTCPPNGALTYASFGQAFAEHYCTRCHSSALDGDARHGAREGFNFDTQGGIRARIAEIDDEAAAGPGGVHDDMPKNDPRPSETERRQLGEWLACGAP